MMERIPGMSEPPITGTVKWFNTTKGYGFLATATHGDLFVHVSALAEGRTALHPGERVTCGVQQGRNGPEASDVHVTEPAPPANAARGVHDPAAANAVAMISTQLGETKSGAQQQIRRIVGRLGADAALAFLAQAQEVEAAGGMMLPDGSRRRTPGGVFFALVRASVSATDRTDLFPPFNRRSKAPRSAPSSAQGQPGSAPSSAQGQPRPSTPPFTWADRIAAIQALGDSRGEIRTVKVTLIGRPGKIVEKPDLVLTAMESAKAPALPKGLPTPPATPTTYIVYIARKQWAGVTEALKNPEDALIVEGWAVYDPELEGIAVFAMNTTTKQLQAAKRQQQAPREAQPGA